MSNELMKIDFTQDQIDLIKSQIAPKATNDELKLFIYQAKRTGLDPLARQIYAIHRKSGNQEKMTIQTSIDGFRVIAERSGDYAGQDEPTFEEFDGKPLKATVRVYRFRGDQRYCAAVGVAYWDEYVPLVDEWINGSKTGKKVPSPMWLKMPHTMLAKVAEALALRKAYPQDLSGLYTSDEMQQADEIKEEPLITTSFNHKELAKNGLPLITNKQFKQACERIAAGEKDIYFKVIADFSMEEKQKDILKQTYDSLKTQVAISLK